MLTVFAIWLAGVAMTLVWMFRAAARPADDMTRHLDAVEADILRAARDRHPSAR